MEIDDTGIKLKVMKMRGRRIVDIRLTMQNSIK
jgi:hypothetical protein